MTLNVGGMSKPRGNLGIQVFRNLDPDSIDRLPAERVSLDWQLRNWSRWGIGKKQLRMPLVGLYFPKLSIAVPVPVLYMASGWRNAKRAAQFSLDTGIVTFVPELKAKLIKADGRIIDYGVISRRVITDAGVAFLVDDWDNDLTDITLMHFHASGTGTVAEAVGDTALGAEATTITDRATGTESQPAANQLRTIGTQTFTGAGAITEHGIFSVVTESAGVLWDRSVFAAINVVNTDSIQFTYTATINSGG